MILWIICLTALLWSTTKCEPPVSSYLPPTGSGSRPSSQYGTPGIGGQRGIGQSPQSQRFQNQPDSYNAPGSGSLSQEYGVPGQESGFGRGSSRGFGQGNVPSSQYGTPGGLNGQSSFGAGGNRPQSTYGTPNQNGGSPFGARTAQRPDSSYGVPSSGFQSPGDFGSDGFSGPGSPRGGRGRQSQGRIPSSSYGTPDFGNDLGSSQNYRGSGVDGPNEPAKYQFSYEVDDAETGTKFGHSEQRDGDVAIGEYNVVLPDGRKQIVEYEADQDGYKPQIRYEGDASGSGTGFGLGGGRGVGQGGQGYPRGGAGADAFANAEGYPSGFGSQGGLGQGGFGQDAGYPGRGGPGRGGSGRGQGQRGSGFGSGDEDGYPSGGPNGPRGSGY